MTQISQMRHDCCDFFFFSRLRQFGDKITFSVYLVVLFIMKLFIIYKTHNFTMNTCMLKEITYTKTAFLSRDLMKWRCLATRIFPDHLQNIFEKFAFCAVN